MKKWLMLVLLGCFSWKLHASACDFYFFGGGGISSTFNIHNSDTITINGAPTPYDATLVASNLTGSALVGLGYQVLPCFGFQGEFVYWGDQDYGVTYQFPGQVLSENGGAKTYSYGIEALFYLPLCCETVSPFVKVGYARYHSNWRFGSNTGIPIDENARFTNTGNGLVFGAGIAFAYSRCLDVAFQAQALYTDTQNVIATHVTLFQYSINLVYHFSLGR